MNARTMMSTMAPETGGVRGDRPITILIAALGGEGGGVLTQWIVEAALHAGYPVQSTSIPGVAQRTGATTYYVEIFPVPQAELGTRRPILNLAPVAGRIDLLIASELLEAVRAAQSGYVDRGRTTVIASTSRALTNREKGAMGDGREDDGRLLDVLVANSRRHVGFDMNAEARDARTVISAVMFGAVAGSGLLPFDRSHCEAAITASGKGVDASLDGFERGFGHALGRPDLAVAARVDHERPTPAASEWPVDVRDMIGHGIARIVDYQDRRYADLYRARVRQVLELEQRIDPSGVHGHALTRETARFLALWMAFDDVVRVADLKTRGDRYARIRAEVGARDDEDRDGPRLFQAAPRRSGRRVAAGAVGARGRMGCEAASTGKEGARFPAPVAQRLAARPSRVACGRVATPLPAGEPALRGRAGRDRTLAGGHRARRDDRLGPGPRARAVRPADQGYGDTHARGHETSRASSTR